MRKTAASDKSDSARSKPAVTVEILYWLFSFGYLILKCLYFQYTARINYKPLFSTVNINMLISSVGILLIMTAVVFALFNKKRRLALIVFNLVLTLLLFADILYFRYYHNAITVPVLYQIGLVGSLGESMADLLKKWDILLLLDLPVLTAWYIILSQKKGTMPIGTLKRLTAAFTAAVIGFVLFQISYQRVYTIHNVKPVKLFSTDKINVIKDLGIFCFHIYDVIDFSKENLFVNRTPTAAEIKEIEAYYAMKPVGGSEYRGAAKGMNLIIIQLESLQEFLVNRKFNGAEITPNLNRLIKESLYFNNMYYQVGNGNTSDAEFLCNVSLYPVKEGAVYFRYPVNTYYSLPRALRNIGYKTHVYHAYSPSFWNRTVMYKTIGFDAFYSNRNYKIDEVAGWGLSDASFFRQSLEIMDTGKPFYDFFITLSSHYPNYFFENSKNFNAGKYEKSSIGNYIKAAHYTDACVGEFINGLKKRGIYDRSLVVIYGDHFGLLKKDAGELAEFLGCADNEYEWAKLQKIPCLIHYPGLKSGRVIDTVGGEIDIMPTIVNLMDVKMPYALGKDLLNAKNGYAVMRNGSYVTDRHIYLKDTGKAYDMNSGNILGSKDYEEELKKFQKDLRISDLIITRNAFKKIVPGGK